MHLGVEKGSFACKFNSGWLKPVTSKHTRLRFAKLDALTKKIFLFDFHPHCGATGPS